MINSWNDQYSPRKTPKARPRAPSDDDQDGGYESPSLKASRSPTKSAMRSPNKRDKGEIAARKAFEAQKHALATSFLAELDHTITSNQIAVLTASTGGVAIVWNKKLTSTAGRANWRREAVRTRGTATGTTALTTTTTTTTTTYTHHAHIELAEKVISDTDRLLNVIAHEFCHLANFMVSGVRDSPHGKEFRAWAGKVSEAFADRNIVVTTKHSYVISYKYVWACEECGLEFKRYSKSIDPKRHACGVCRNRLVQVKPPPRQAEAGGYQLWVKENYKRVRAERVELSMGQVMAELARGYREMKEKEGKGKENWELGGGVQEIVEVESEGEGECEDLGGLMGRGKSEELGVDDVLGRLGGLSL